MSIFNYGTIPSWILNPVGNLFHLIDRKTDDHSRDQPLITRDEIDRTVSNIYDDLTGKSQIELQNKLDREMAEEEYQRNLESIGDTKAAYEAAGFNPNLMYGSASQASYEAPKLQAYSGSAKLDSILSRTGKVLGMIPALYQATAALEGIDQARERTKQSEIKTMSMGMNLLDLGYRLGDMYFKKPYFLSFSPKDFGSKRHVNDFWSTANWLPWFHGDTSGKGRQSYYNYADAALKNTFDLLASVGIKNQMNTTLNNWRGYQYSLDRKFGAAGRIVGMASQGIGAVSKFLPLNSFWKR